MQLEAENDGLKVEKEKAKNFHGRILQWNISGMDFIGPLSSWVNCVNIRQMHKLRIRSDTNNTIISLSFHWAHMCASMSTMAAVADGSLFVVIEIKFIWRKQSVSFDVRTWMNVRVPRWKYIWIKWTKLYVCVCFARAELDRLNDTNAFGCWKQHRYRPKKKWNHLRCAPCAYFWFDNCIVSKWRGDYFWNSFLLLLFFNAYRSIGYVSIRWQSKARRTVAQRIDELCKWEGNHRFNRW